MTTAYPLSWPLTIPRFKTSRQSGSFKTSLEGALKNVNNSLKLFASDSGNALSNVIISSNVTLGAYKPSDPGVAVWFTWDDLQVCIPVDRYSSVEANLQAIHHIIEARRVELRHGTLALVRASFQGFAALPAPSGDSWRAVLGLGQVVTKDEIETAYKKLASRHHPDKPGGSTSMMQKINTAREQAFASLSQ